MLKRHELIALILMPVLLFLTTPSLAEMIVDTAWVRTYNGPGNSLDQAKAIAVDGSGNVYVTGDSPKETEWPYDFDYITIKYWPNGDTAWVRRYTGSGNSEDIAHAIAVDGSSNVYVTGQSSDSSWYSSDYATIKYYPNGDTAWVRRYNGPGNGEDQAAAIAVDGSGNVYVTGSSQGAGTLADYATAKYTPQGDTAWVRRYNGPEGGQDCAHALAVDAFGNAYVGGYSGSRFVTIKYCPDGDTAWVRGYEGQPHNCCCDGVHMVIDHSGNVYLTGTSVNGYVTIKYCPDGDTAWVRTYNGSSAESWCRVRSIAVNDSGSVFVTGYDQLCTDYITVKYYSNGDTAWVRRYDGQASGWDEARSPKLDLSGNVYVTGLSQENESFGFATVKYYPDGDTAWVRRYMRSEYDWTQDSAMAVDASGNVYVTGSVEPSGSYDCD